MSGKSMLSSDSQEVEESSISTKVKTAKVLMNSVSGPVRIGDETIDVSAEGGVGTLYKRAQQEAGQMMATGDFSFYEDQLQQNQSFMEMLSSMEGQGTGKAASE